MQIFLLILRINFLFIILKLNHILIVMLIFEFIGLNVLFLIVLLFYKKIIYLRLVVLVLLACEASLGLSLLVGVVRCKYLNYVENSNVFVV